MVGRPCAGDVEAAVRVLIAAAGDDPARAGVLETPARVRRAWSEWFNGYGVDVAAVLSATFDDEDPEADHAEVSDYSGVVSVQGYRFHSTCEHHMARITGVADVVYLPQAHAPPEALARLIDDPSQAPPPARRRVVGLSKIGRVVDAFAHRLQVQERMTEQIATALERNLRPRGVFVRIVAEHQCMTTRGVHRPGCWTTTQSITGVYRTDAAARAEVAALLGPACRP